MANTRPERCIIMFSAITCDQPTITDGTVDPTTSVAFEETYTVTCVDPYVLSGSATMTCTSIDGFDQTPSCTGIHFIVLIVRSN